MTALGGLPVVLEMARVMNLASSIDRHVGVRKDGQGWTDSQGVMALILLNIARRIISHSRGLVIRCGRELTWLIDIRRKIGRLGST